MARMGRIIRLAAAVIAVMAVATPALAQRSAYQALIAAHAKANNVPEALVHRVVMRESRYNASLIGRGGVIGLMQIKLPTARSVGYTGDAEGLRDPTTNIAYGVRYLAGAWRLANGSHDRAIALYSNGYYYEAKRAHLPPIHFAALPLVEAKSAEHPDAEPTTAETATTPSAVVSDPDQTVALTGPVPLPRPRPELPGEHSATELSSRGAPDSFSKLWDDVTRLLPGSH